MNEAPELPHVCTIEVMHKWLLDTGELLAKEKLPREMRQGALTWAKQYTPNLAKGLPPHAVVAFAAFIGNLPEETLPHVAMQVLDEFLCLPKELREVIEYNTQAGAFRLVTSASAAVKKALELHAPALLKLKPSQN